MTTGDQSWRRIIKRMSPFQLCLLLKSEPKPAFLRDSGVAFALMSAWLSTPIIHRRIATRQYQELEKS